jgi:hypothetical protein
MVSAFPIVAEHATAVLHAALQSRGFALDDFRLRVETATEWAQSLGVPGGLIKVRCRSTGEERLYPIGSGSAWLGAFMMDLAGGHFARAARMRREPAARARGARSFSASGMVAAIGRAPSTPAARWG